MEWLPYTQRDLIYGEYGDDLQCVDERSAPYKRERCETFVFRHVPTGRYVEINYMSHYDHGVYPETAEWFEVVPRVEHITITKYVPVED